MFARLLPPNIAPRVAAKLWQKTLGLSACASNQATTPLTQPHWLGAGGALRQKVALARLAQPQRAAWASARATGASPVLNFSQLAGLCAGAGLHRFPAVSARARYKKSAVHEPLYFVKRVVARGVSALPRLPAYTSAFLARVGV